MSHGPHCPICQDKIKRNQMVLETDCGHLFHDSCFRKLQKKTGTGIDECPVCPPVKSNFFGKKRKTGGYLDTLSSGAHSVSTTKSDRRRQQSGRGSDFNDGAVTYSEESQSEISHTANIAAFMRKDRGRSQKQDAPISEVDY